MTDNTQLLKEELKQCYQNLLSDLENIAEIAIELAPKGRLERLRKAYKDSWEAAVEFLKGASVVLSKANAAIDAFRKLRENPNLENCEKAYNAFLELGYSVYPLYPRLKNFDLAPLETPPTIHILKRVSPFDRIPEFLDYEVYVSYSEVQAYTQSIHQNSLHIATLISILCFESHGKENLLKELKELEFEEETSNIETNHNEEEYEHGF